MLQITAKTACSHHEPHPVSCRDPRSHAFISLHTVQDPTDSPAHKGGPALNPKVPPLNHPSRDRFQAISVLLYGSSKGRFLELQREPTQGRTAQNGETGGGERDRTDDLMLAKHALSQLSYAPNDVVGQARFELATSRLSSARSNQLSY
jgi:hypothetical protein